MSLPVHEVRSLTQMLVKSTPGGDDDGVHDRGFDLSEVCVCFQVKHPRRYVDGSTHLQGRLNLGGAASDVAAFRTVKAKDLHSGLLNSGGVIAPA